MQMICPALQITENVLKQYLWYVLCGSSFSRTCPFGFRMFVVCIHVGGTDVHANPTECLEGPLRSQSRIGSCRGQRWVDTRIEKLWADVEEKKAYKRIDISVVAHGLNHGDQTLAKSSNGTSQIVFLPHSPHMAANIRPSAMGKGRMFRRSLSETEAKICSGHVSYCSRFFACPFLCNRFDSLIVHLSNVVGLRQYVAGWLGFRFPLVLCYTTAMRACHPDNGTKTRFLGDCCGHLLIARRR